MVAWRTERLKGELKAVGYVRCSTEMQEDSPAQQRMAILEFASQKGYSITDWYEDRGKSGTTFEQRPQFQLLKSDVEKRPSFRAVICYDESRWGRAIDSEENTYWRFHFRRYGVEVILVKTSVDRSNEFAPMLSAFEGVQASGYSKRLSELTLRGAMNNGIYSNGGTAPFGYKRIAVNLKTGAERELTPGEWSISSQEKVRWGVGDLKEVKVVRHIFERRLRGFSLFLIAKELNDDAIPCPKRGRWRNVDQKWSTVTVKSIIENPSYYGARVYNRNSMSKIQAQQRGVDLRHDVSYPHWRNNPTEWTTEESAHEPIVTKQEWKQANLINKQELKVKSNGYVYRGRYLLTGIVRCSRCGFPFQGCSSSVNGRKYWKYVDGGWKNKGVCSHLGISKALLEDFAIKVIKETLTEPNLVERIEAQLKSLIESNQTDNSDEIKDFKGRLAENDKKIRNLIEAIEKTGGSQTLYDRLKTLEDEKELLQERLKSKERAGTKRINSAKISEDVRRFILEFEKRFEAAPIVEQKFLIKKMISAIGVDREKEVVQFFVRLVPSISPEVEDLLEKRKGLSSEIASPQSSGGRT